MNNQKISKEDEAKDGMNSISIAVAGAVVGAGLAATGILLADEKNREKIKASVKSTLNNMNDLVDKTKNLLAVEKKILDGEIKSNERKISKVVSSAKNLIDKTTTEINNVVKSL